VATPGSGAEDDGPCPAEDVLASADAVPRARADSTDPSRTMEEIMADLPCDVVIEGWATGYDALFIVVWVMCEDRGRLASKFAAECTEGNHEPWLVLEKLRRGMAKHFKPEWWPSQFGDLPAVPTELLCRPSLATYSA